MVDHNEYGQSIKDLEYGEILEIVDHHRLGGLETNVPISVTSLRVGSCASIIAKMYLDNKIELSSQMAGILLGAIISDTLCLKSPTTTELDKKLASSLSQLAQVDIDELAQSMIEAND